MRRSKALFAAVALLLGCTQLAAVAQEHPSRLEISGGLDRASGNFRLDISHEAGSTLRAGQTLLVYAEPSHSLLVAHVGSAVQQRDDYGEALALMKGRVLNFRHSLTLPYQPFTDRRVVVVLRANDGQESVLADALVNLRKFDFSTSYSTDGDDPGQVTAAATYTHCCRGARCERMCVECDTAQFTCDLINCDIQCGHDASWPPKV